MKKRIGNTLIVILIAVSALLLSSLGPNERVAQSESAFQPSYHLMPYRAEFTKLFYETPERVGFQVLDGIFLYNYQEGYVEADFALSEGCFEPGYLIWPGMSTNEKSIIIGGVDHSAGTWSDHYYSYDIKSKKLVRMNGEVTEVATLPYPATDRQMNAFQADSWELEDLRYYPMGSDKVIIPFKVEEIPTMVYVMQGNEQDSLFSPKLTLMADGRFQFTYSLLSSYLNYGEYSIAGMEYKMVTKDGQHTFVFHKEGDNFVFDAERSSRCILDDRTELPDGAVFSA
ncbi:hypothetical protein Desdi_0318 [Desulfitobacterium dichloroeliminans LMG P-21439]|uniref:Uncharacterized protein n=1 Tax=Desulfitobacterium dichloroeliminans (strain LMG P-21439 / DCA1) TaxID=871963 RepID=L0F5C2_DESDL|nr:hypothetical protein [Desulfitobacterium dichloroeliminans]AGA67866.1 hypothetical protein Desdi_0318 [Desulfitobacterium dichloroeliminans LMG P-21439]